MIIGINPCNGLFSATLSVPGDWNALLDHLTLHPEARTAIRVVHVDGANLPANVFLSQPLTSLTMPRVEVLSLKGVLFDPILLSVLPALREIILSDDLWSGRTAVITSDPALQTRLSSLTSFSTINILPSASTDMVHHWLPMLAYVGTGRLTRVSIIPFHNETQREAIRLFFAAMQSVDMVAISMRGRLAQDYAVTKGFSLGFLPVRSLCLEVRANEDTNPMIFGVLQQSLFLCMEELVVAIELPAGDLTFRPFGGAGARTGHWTLPALLQERLRKVSVIFVNFHKRDALELTAFLALFGAAQARLTLDDCGQGVAGPPR